MTKGKIYECRICGKRDIDPSTQIEGVDYVNKSNKIIYLVHKSCYDRNEKIKNDPTAIAENNEWFALLKDYLAKDLKVQINYPKLDSQWKSFLKKGLTAKGIYFAIKYFYDIKKNPIDDTNGIGIVPYIYEESKKYWYDLEARRPGIIQGLTEQVFAMNSQRVVTIQQPKEKKVKSFVDWDAISSMEEEDAG